MFAYLPLCRLFQWDADSGREAVSYWQMYVHAYLFRLMHLDEECSVLVVECLTYIEWSWFKSHRNDCVLSLTKTIYPLLSTGSTQETSWHD